MGKHKHGGICQHRFALDHHLQTSLLDFIRKSKVAAGEAGGITQVRVKAYVLLLTVV